MKILHVTQNYFPSIGGTQHTMKKVSEYLHDTFHDNITLFTSDSFFAPNRLAYKKITPHEELINGIMVKRFGFMKNHKKLLRIAFKFSGRVLKRPAPFFFQNIFSGPYSVSMFRSMLETDADVIGVSSAHYMFADYPLWRKRSINPRPFVLYGALHLSDENSVPEQYFDRVRNCEYYIANTSFEKDFLTGKNIDSEKIIVLGAGTDLFTKKGSSDDVLAIKEKYGYTQDDIVITYIGRHEGMKNIQLLIEAFFVLSGKHANIKLIIAGAEGSFTSKLKEIASGNANIFVLTNISEEEKCNILNICDLLVLPSAGESFGVVFLEAWSFFKPVIGANIGAVASVIDHAKNGYLFNRDDINSLVHYIGLLIEDKNKRIDFGLAGYKKVQEYYTWGKIATGFRRAYELAIEKFAKKSKDRLIHPSNTLRY